MILNYKIYVRDSLLRSLELFFSCSHSEWVNNSSAYAVCVVDIRQARKVNEQLLCSNEFQPILAVRSCLEFLMTTIAVEFTRRRVGVEFGDGISVLSTIWVNKKYQLSPSDTRTKLSASKTIVREEKQLMKFFLNFRDFEKQVPKKFQKDWLLRNMNIVKKRLIFNYECRMRNLNLNEHKKSLHFDGFPSSA